MQDRYGNDISAQPQAAVETDENNRTKEKWSCVNCTYDNWKCSNRCTMCRMICINSPQLINESTTTDVDNYDRISLVTKDEDEHVNKNTSSGTDIYQLSNTTTENFRLMKLNLEPDPTINNSSQQLIYSGSSWSCCHCTFVNGPKSSRCSQCLTLRTGKRGSPVNTSSSASTNKQINTNISHKKNLQNDTAPSPSTVFDVVFPRVSLSSNLPSTSFHDFNNERNKRTMAKNKPLGKKWACVTCTYENWPRTNYCTLCGVPRTASQRERDQYIQRHASSRCLVLSPSSESRGPPSPPQGASSQHTQMNKSSVGSNNNVRRRRGHRSSIDISWAWLTACMGVVEGDPGPVEAYLNGGGSPTRKLTHSEATLLGGVGTGHDGIYEAGHTLVHLAIKMQREDLLASLLSQLERGATSGVKCVASYVAPDLASSIRRHIAQNMRQRKGDFQCYYITECPTYTLPQEIEDLPALIQEQLYSELMDREAQKELEDSESPIINWSDEICRLTALWNRSTGDCLLDSLLQATWGVFDRGNVLRRALSDSLHQAGHLFYPRWKEWERQQSMNLGLDVTLNDCQWSEDWSVLLALASQPGASLEQLHIFCLAHVLRRPIIVYGVKYVKSWRGENLGFARFEGVYLPLLWENYSSFCSRSPIALGYTRGHFCALVPPEPDSVGVAGAVNVRHPGSPPVASTSRGGILPMSTAELTTEKSAFLSLMTCDRNILPIHFLKFSELNDSELILQKWLNVCITDSGLLVAQQKINKPPLLVEQLTEEWLNHYRKMQSSQAPLNSRSSPPISRCTTVSNDQSNEEIDDREPDQETEAC